MPFSLAEFVPELTLLRSEALPQEDTTPGLWSNAYTLVFGLITVDDQGQALFSRGFDQNNNPIIVDRQGSPVDLQNVSASLPNRFDSDFSPATDVDPAAWVFLRGVPDVNAGTGGYSAFIREYTIEQYQIRFGENAVPNGFDSLEEGVQAASNAIALSIVEDILSLKGTPENPNPNPNHELPNASNIAIQDAQAAANILFDPAGEHPEQIAGWAGNPFFLALGVDGPYRQNILHTNPSTGDITNPDTGDVLSVIAAMKSAAVTLGIEPTLNLLSDVLLHIIPDAGSHIPTIAAATYSTDAFLAQAYGISSDSALPVLAYFVLADTQVDLSDAGSTFAGSNNDNDVIYAGAGNDTIQGSLHNDFIDGGSGTDSLVYTNMPHGVDVMFMNTGGTLYQEGFRIEHQGFQPHYIDFAYSIENLTLTNFEDEFTPQSPLPPGTIIDMGGDVDRSTLETGTWHFSGNGSLQEENGARIDGAEIFGFGENATLKLDAVGAMPQPGAAGESAAGIPSGVYMAGTVDYSCGAGSLPATFMTDFSNGASVMQGSAEDIFTWGGTFVPGAPDVFTFRGSDHGDTITALNGLTIADSTIITGTGDDVVTYLNTVNPLNYQSNTQFVYTGGDDVYTGVVDWEIPPTGADVIFARNTFTLGEGITAADVRYTSNGADVIYEIAGRGSITFADTQDMGVFPVLQLSDGTLADQQNGSNGDDVLDVVAGFNTAFAYDGDDTIVLASGAEATLYDGGDGNDTLDLSHAVNGVTVQLAATQMGMGVSDASGFTHVSYDTAFVTTPLSLSVQPSSPFPGPLFSQIANTTAEGFDILFFAPSQGGPVSISFGYTASSAGHLLSSDFGNADLVSIENIITGDGDDIIAGGDGSNLLYANAGDDNVYAGGGNDTIIAGSGLGDDVYDGGTGDDTIVYSSATNGIFVDLAGGFAFGADIGSDQFSNIENVVGGAGDDRIAGNLGANTLSGAGGDDIYTVNPAIAGQQTIDDSIGANVLSIFVPDPVNTGFIFTQVGDDLLITAHDNISNTPMPGTMLVKNWFIDDADGRPIAVMEVNGQVFRTADQIDEIFFPTNEAPNAVDDMFDAGNMASVAGNVLTNDTDPDGDAITAVSGTYTTAGGNSFVLEDNGDFMLNVGGLFQGNDSFTYQIQDDGGLTDTATVNITGLLGNLVPPSITLGADMLSAAVSETITAHDYIPTPQNFPDLIERGQVDEDIVNGVMRENLTLSQDHNVKVNFVSEGAGYKNSLGYYVTDAAGVITGVQMLATNLSGTGAGVYGGGDFNAGDLIADLGVLAAGTQINFFIVADGFHKNKEYSKLDLEDGHFEFIANHKNQIADITDRAHDLDLVFINDTTGDVTKINGNVYHSSTSISNKDGDIHALSGINENGNLQIGFEDLYKGGDHDFNDVVIEVEISPHVDHVFDPVTLLSGIDIADPHGGSFIEATIAFTAGQQSGDSLSLDDTLLTGAGVIATHNADGSLTLAGTASDTTYEFLLQNIKFDSNTDDPAVGVRSFDISVTNDLHLSTQTAFTLDIANDTTSPITPMPGAPAPIVDPALAAVDSLLDGQDAFRALNGYFSLSLDHDFAAEVSNGLNMEDPRWSWFSRDGLKLKIDDVFEQGDTFVILGNHGDIVTIQHAQLTLQDTRAHDGETYNVYSTSKGVTLVIDADVTVKGGVERFR
ncbi:MAG: Ig-like domain-containing protein [Alphaproteobacteria bacterium]|nr:Ig-like domain-containing protein [Alphaproteobacteria bacterium]